MSSIFGIIDKTGNEVNKSDFVKFGNELAHWKPDKSAILIEGNIALGQHMLYTTSESRNENLPYVDTKTGLIIVADARIDYRDALLKELEEPDDVCNKIADSHLIIRAYQKWGKDCAKHLFGDFSFAIANPQTQELFCCRDHFGCRPFFYYNDEDVFIFSSELKAILPNTPRKAEIDEGFIVSSLAYLPFDKKKTPYINIKRLPPANILMLKPHEIEFENYWSLEINPKYLNYSEDEAKKELLKLLKRSVREKCRTDSEVGSELSGGLDSSGITSLAYEIMKETGKKLNVYSHVLGDNYNRLVFPFKDEAYFSDMLVNHLKIEKHIKVDSYFISSTKLMEEYMDLTYRPAWLLYAVMSDQLIQEANFNGARVLLSGFGGDQAVTSSGSGALVDILGTSGLTGLKKHLYCDDLTKKAQCNRMILITILRRWFPFIFSYKNLLYWRKGSPNKRTRERLINKSLIKKYKVRKRLRKQSFHSSDRSARERVKNNLEGDGVSERLETTWLLAQKKHIEYRYCLLDVKLIELYYSLPSSLKHKNGFGRYIYRVALNDILPSEICWRPDKSGATIPGSYSRLLDDELAVINYIDDAERYNAFHYVNYTELRAALSKLKKKSQNPKIGVTNRDILSPLTVLILQKWQREGKINIGIKC